jgi:glycosyltransferase involved in cell wall biosynthesis
MSEKAYPALSACLIVRNEEAVLPTCLENVRQVAAEIVVVDTGSTDRTAEIARDFGARLFHFAWRDDFSAARNESLRRATGDWVLYIDADEVIRAADLPKVRAVVERDDIMAATVRQRIPQPAGNVTTAVYSEYCRLFHNHPQIRFTGRVHEQILPAIERLGGRVLRTDIVIEHWAYAATPQKKRRRAERNLRLLLADADERPGDPFVALNLGLTYRELDDEAEATRWLRRAGACDDGRIKRELLARAHIALAQMALSADDLAGADDHARSAEPLDTHNPLAPYIRATVAVARGDLAAAVSHLGHAIEIAEGSNGRSPTVGMDKEHLQRLLRQLKRKA